MKSLLKILSLLILINSNVFTQNINSLFEIAPNGDHPNVIKGTDGVFNVAWDNIDTAITACSYLPSGVRESDQWQLPETIAGFTPRQAIRKNILETCYWDRISNMISYFRNYIQVNIRDIAADTSFTFNIMSRIDIPADFLRFVPDILFVDDTTMFCAWAGDGTSIKYGSIVKGILGKFISTNGNLLSSDILISGLNIIYGAFSSPKIELLESQNKIAAAWVDDHTGESKLYLRYIDIKSHEVSDSLLISGENESWLFYLSMEKTSNDDIILAWGADSDGKSHIFTRKISSDGKSLSEIIELSSDEHPAMVFASTSISIEKGTVAIAWESSQSGNSKIFCSLMDENLNKISDPFPIGDTTSSYNQIFPTTALHNGTLFSSWRENKKIFGSTISIDSTVAVNENELKNEINFKLSPNFPNPFNPSTKINYSIPNKEFVNLKVYNILGKEVAELVNSYKNEGNYNVTFNADNLPSGVYIYTLTAGNYSKNRKMLLLK